MSLMKNEVEMIESCQNCVDYFTTRDEQALPICTKLNVQLNRGYNPICAHYSPRKASACSCNTCNYITNKTRNRAYCTQTDMLIESDTSPCIYYKSKDEDDIRKLSDCIGNITNADVVVVYGNVTGNMIS